MNEFSSILKKYKLREAGYIGPGWWPLFEELVRDLIELGWDRDLQQVKEKFGGLRFYVGDCTDEMANRISKAEAESFKICENCGKPGKRSKGTGWILTLCEEC